MEIKVLLESKEVPLDAQQMGITMDTPETEIVAIPSNRVNVSYFDTRL